MVRPDPSLTHRQSLLVFVTGATAGIGAAIARRFLTEGHRVIAAGRRTERLDPLDDVADGRLLKVALDVRDREAVLRCISDLPAEFREVDVLVNNAGLALGLDPAQSADLDQWDVMIDTNVNGLLYMTRAVLPGMVERRRGHVINIGSVAGTYPYPGGNVYGATKSLVQHLSLNLRADLHGTRVRVTYVAPGMVGGTEFSTVRFGGDEGRAGKVYDGAEPMTAEDVAEAVYWVSVLPERMNVNVLEVMPVCQSFSPLQIDRG